MSAPKIDLLPLLPELAAEVTSLRMMEAALRKYASSKYYGSSDSPLGLAERVVDKLAQAERDESERRKQLEALCKAAGIEHLDIGALTAWIRTSVAIRRSVATAEGTT